MKKYKFIDLFAGCGGWFSPEWQIYRYCGC